MNHQTQYRRHRATAARAYAAARAEREAAELARANGRAPHDHLRKLELFKGLADAEVDVAACYLPLIRRCS